VQVTHKKQRFRDHHIQREVLVQQLHAICDHARNQSQAAAFPAMKNMQKELFNENKSRMSDFVGAQLAFL
jgi:hypothetical protein